VVDFVGNIYQEHFLSSVDFKCEFGFGIESKKIAATMKIGEKYCLSGVEATKEVHYFFGEAIAKVRCKLEKRLSEDEFWQSQCTFVTAMGTSHDAIISNREYIDKYYPTIVQLHNERNKLTLVSKEYFGYGLDLMQSIGTYFNEETIGATGTACIETVYTLLMKDDKLKHCFLECSDAAKLQVDDCFVDNIYEQLVKNTFHARAGAESRKFKEKNTSRYAVGTLDQPFRTQLKTASKRDPKNKGK
jgi:hypothetical protein